MRCAPHVLLCFFASLWSTYDIGNTAKGSANPELLTAFAKNVATVLSPALLSELQGNRTNRSAVNLGRTVSEKRTEELVASPTSNNAVNEKIGSDVHYSNEVYPYHYERRYQYTYPPYTERRSFENEAFYNPYIPSIRPEGSEFYQPQIYVGDFQRARHGLIPGPFLARGYGYFGPAGFEPHVPYHHPPFYGPPQNPVTPSDQSPMPGNGGTESNSSSTNQETRQRGQPATYGSPIVSSFHLQGYPSASFNLLPYDRFNNVFNGNTTNVPYFSPSFHGWHGGYNFYLPPSTTPGPPTSQPDEMPKTENPDAEKIDQSADTGKPPENIETSGSNRHELKVPFPSAAYNERRKAFQSFFYPYRI